MKYANSKLSLLLATLTLVVFTGGTALADDTELFVAGLDPAANSNVRPNVLFIIDTSGSMGTNVKTQVAYDESIDFSGGGSACYKRDAIYWSLSNSPPNCASESYFWKSRNLCQDSQERLTNLGEYAGQLLQWRVRSNRDDKWVDVQRQQSPAGPLCRMRGRSWQERLLAERRQVCSRWRPVWPVCGQLQPGTGVDHHLLPL